MRACISGRGCSAPPPPEDEEHASRDGGGCHGKREAAADNITHRRPLCVGGDDGGVGDGCEVVAERRPRQNGEAQHGRVCPEEVPGRIENRSQGYAGARTRTGAKGKEHGGHEHHECEYGTLCACGHAHPEQAVHKPPCDHELAEHSGEKPRSDDDDTSLVADATHGGLAVIGFVAGKEQPQCYGNPCTRPEGFRASTLRYGQPYKPTNERDERNESPQYATVHFKALFHDVLLLCEP